LPALLGFDRLSGREFDDYAVSSVDSMLGPRLQYSP
jgi:hypothetical protein